MSQKFDIKRFGKVLAYDLQRCKPSNCSSKAGGLNGLVGLELFTLPFLPTLIGITLGLTNHMETIHPISRVFTILFVAVIMAAWAPEMHYGTINQQGRGIYYAMLPASKLEKYLSMLLMSVVVFPLIVLIGAFVIDTLVALLPFSLYKEFLWQVDRAEMLGLYHGAPAWWTVRTIVELVLGYLMGAMGFVFGNTLFRKHKTAWTLLCFFAIGFVVSLATLAISALYGAEIDTHLRTMHVATGTLYAWVFRTGAGMQLLAVVLLTYFSWKKIKNVGY